MRNRAAVIFLCYIYLYSEDTPSQVSHIVDHLRQVGTSQVQM